MINKKWKHNIDLHFYEKIICTDEFKKKTCDPIFPKYIILQYIFQFQILLHYFPISHSTTATLIIIVYEYFVE